MSGRPTTPQLCLLLTQLLAGSCLDILFRRTAHHHPPLPLSFPRLNCSCRQSAGSAELGSAPGQLEGGSGGDVAGYVAETGLVVRLNLGKHPPPYRPCSGAGSKPADVEVSRRGSADISSSPWRVEAAPHQRPLDDLTAAWRAKRAQIAWCRQPADEAALVYTEELAEVYDVVVMETPCSAADAASRYRFVIVSEPTLCEGRVPDDVYEVLDSNSIPVVFASFAYTHLPPVSFLHAIATPPEYLAHTANTIVSDPEPYFQWRLNWRLVHDSSRWLCELCELVGEKRDIWYGNEGTERCHRYLGDGGFAIDWGD